MNETKTVVILGASNKPDRYSYKAFRMLKDNGHKVIPVNPVLDEIEGIVVKHSIEEVKGEVDTVTLYMRPERTEPLAEKIIGVKPRRVIFNPGTESQVLEERLRGEGIEALEACTLVLLRTGRF